MLHFLLSVFLYTNPYNPPDCDSIELLKGNVFYELHYVNSENKCSTSGEWVLELDGLEVQVRVTMGRDGDEREEVNVQMLDELGFIVEPSETQILIDSGESTVFYLVPPMF